MNPHNPKPILENIFYQLLIVYTLLVLLIALGLFWKYTLQFQIFALIIAGLGIAILYNQPNQEKRTTINKKAHYILFGIAILLIIFFRTLPYIGNSIPLGYDAGIYKYGIEHGLQNLDNWILQGGFEPGFLYLVSFLNLFLSSHFILTTLLILFSAVLGIAVYFVVKEFSDSKTGLIALFIYAFSIVQFRAFAMMYYKNILGMILILFSIYFLKKSEKNKKLVWLFVLLGGLIGAIHRPSFYIFGLSYFVYALISPYKDRRYNFNQLGKNILYGLVVVIIAGLFYLGRFSKAITIMFEPVLQGFIQPGEASGTFINFFTFQFSSLFYLPLALLGLFYFIKKKDFNILVIWAIINFAIVYFQFFFFNRMIIFLDLVLIILASIGFSVIIKDTKKVGAIIMIALLVSAGLFAFANSSQEKSLIDDLELQIIQNLSKTEQDAYVMSTSSYYSPWVIGYSERKTIAPGLFNYNLDDRAGWQVFWTTSNLSEIKSFLDKYPKPIYIFIGQRQKNNLAQFNDSGCFDVFAEQGKNVVYRYGC